MALPKIASPTFMLDIPSTGETIRYRPFTVKEEKVLLIASSGDDEKQVVEAIKQIINNCVLDKIDVDDLSIYDLEYLFLQLRSKSVNNVIEFKFVDEDDNNTYESTLDLEDIKIVKDPSHEYTLNLNDEVSLIMKDPTYETVQKINKLGDNSEKAMMEIISLCIDKVLVGDDEVLNMGDYTKKEQQDFIESFSSKNMIQIQEFFNTVPRLKHSFTYKTEGGETKTKEIVGLQSFFT